MNIETHTNLWMYLPTLRAVEVSVNIWRTQALESDTIVVSS